MANAKRGNTWYIDTVTPAVITAEKNQKVAQIIFTSSGAADSIVLSESSSAATTKITITEPAATTTKVVDLSASPLIFSQGIYLQSMSAGATATLIMV